MQGDRTPAEEGILRGAFEEKAKGISCNQYREQAF